MQIKIAEAHVVIDPASIVQRELLALFKKQLADYGRQMRDVLMNVTGMVHDRAVQNQNNLMANKIIRITQNSSDLFNQQLKMDMQPLQSVCGIESIGNNLGDGCFVQQLTQELSQAPVDAYNNMKKPVDGTVRYQYDQVEKIAPLVGEKQQSVTSAKTMMLNGPLSLNNKKVSEQKKFIWLLLDKPARPIDLRSKQTFQNKKQQLIHDGHLTTMSAVGYPLFHELADLSENNGKPSFYKNIAAFGSEWTGQYGIGKAFIKNINDPKTSTRATVLRQTAIDVAHKNYMSVKKYKQQEEKNLELAIWLNHLLEEERNHE